MAMNSSAGAPGIGLEVTVASGKFLASNLPILDHLPPGGRVQDEGSVLLVKGRWHAKKGPTVHDDA